MDCGEYIYMGIERKWIVVDIKWIEVDRSG